MIAIFTYEFKKASDGFSEAGCRVDALSNYSPLIDAAVKNGYISTSDVETLKKWRIDPSIWGKN